MAENSRKLNSLLTSRQKGPLLFMKGMSESVKLFEIDPLQTLFGYLINSQQIYGEWEESFAI